MPKYSVTIGANIRAYTTIMIEAADDEAAYDRAEVIVDLGFWSEPESSGAFFEPEFDLIDGFTVVDDPELLEEDA